MKHFILSAFADEYNSNFEEQLKALNRFDIDYLEIRFVDEKKHFSSF